MFFAHFSQISNNTLIYYIVCCPLFPQKLIINSKIRPHDRYILRLNDHQNHISIIPITSIIFPTASQSLQQSPSIFLPLLHWQRTPWTWAQPYQQQRISPTPVRSYYSYTMPHMNQESSSSKLLLSFRFPPTCRRKSTARGDDAGYSILFWPRRRPCNSKRDQDRNQYSQYNYAFYLSRCQSYHPSILQSQGLQAKNFLDFLRRVERNFMEDLRADRGQPFYSEGFLITRNVFSSDGMLTSQSSFFWEYRSAAKEDPILFFICLSFSLKISTFLGIELRASLEKCEIVSRVWVTMGILNSLRASIFW